MSSSSAEALTPALASRLASIALGHVTREYPNKLDHVLIGPNESASPRALHPIFYGSFDWHSCVHSYWLLATLHRLVPAMAEAREIRRLFDDAVIPENVAAECEYLARPGASSFERPYGWAWLLMLQCELSRIAEPWSGILRPLADAFVDKFCEWLPRATYPVRAGTHGNTAFALRLALEYAESSGDDDFARLLGATAMRWYAQDADCPCWEPGGEDFLSSALVEAQCMGAAIDRAPFRKWLGRFLPDLGEHRPATLFQPAFVSDRTDGRIVHLDGLNLSRAWSWREIASRLDPDDPIRAIIAKAAEVHFATSLPSITGHYMGEHWLATYALLAATTMGRVAQSG